MENSDFQDSASNNICRICRCPSSEENFLFFPCNCSGSIKYIHQKCLEIWLEFSKKTKCELCNHEFKFKSIYSSDAPQNLPSCDVLNEFWLEIKSHVANFLHYLLVLTTWILLIPLISWRIFQCISSGSIYPVFNIFTDIFIMDISTLYDCLFGITLSLIFFLFFFAYGYMNEILSQNGIPLWLQDPSNIDFIQSEEEFSDQEEEDFALPHHTRYDDHQDVEARQEEERELNAIQNNEDNIEEEAMQIDHIPDNINEVINWDNVLGFDGTIAFVEHIIWIVIIQTIFIIVFTLLPHNIGQIFLINLNFDQKFQNLEENQCLTTTIGYLMILVLSFVANYIFRFFKFNQAGRFFGLIYLYMKVGLIYSFEMIVLPIISGVWIDICSISLTEQPLSKRIKNFNLNKTTFIYFHWTRGMLFSFYLTTVFHKFSATLRPGFLWFIRYFNNPVYRPIKTLIYSPLLVYLQSIMIYQMLVGILIAFTFFLPSTIIKELLPTFFPYKLTENFDCPLDYIFEIILSQFLFPITVNVLTKSLVLRKVLRAWCVMFGNLFGLRSYILGDVPIKKDDPIVDERGNTRKSKRNINPEEDEEDYDLESRESTFKCYLRPRYFEGRVFLLSIVFLFTWVLLTCLLILLPTYLGRKFHREVLQKKTQHDVINFMIGSVILFMSVRLLLAFRKCLGIFSVQFYHIFNSLLSHALCILQCTGVFVFLLIIYPIAIGLFIELTLLAPFLVPLKRTVTPLLCNNWILGFTCHKVIILSLNYFPDCLLQQIINSVYEEINSKRFRVGFLSIFNLLLPVTTRMAIFLICPYLMSHHLPLMNQCLDRSMIQRFGYLFQVSLLACHYLLRYLQKHLQIVHANLFDKRFLIGKKLMNMGETD